MDKHTLWTSMYSNVPEYRWLLSSEQTHGGDGNVINTLKDELRFDDYKSEFE